jgi:hypothetical protein
MLPESRTPRFKYGQAVQDLMRGTVLVLGLSDAPIPWPVIRRGSGNMLALYGDLARAVRRESNQAVAHHWGVTGQTVTGGCQTSAFDSTIQCAVAFGLACGNFMHFRQTVSIRLRKIANGNGSGPPVTDAFPIHLLHDIPRKDAYQIICYENNTAAFFCDRVVLVEGDCDLIFLKPHLKAGLRADPLGVAHPGRRCRTPRRFPY